MAKPRFVQSQKTTLKAPISDTETGEILLKHFQDLSGNNLSMSDFGDKGYLTLNPGNEKEEIIAFTGFTVNDDDTVSIDTGIERGLESKHPYGSGGTASEHGAGDVVVISNNPQVLDAIITYAEGLANSGAADADIDTKGLVEIATDAEGNSGDTNGSTGARLVLPADYRNSLNNNEKDAVAGGRGQGTPSDTNRFITEKGLKEYYGDGSDGALDTSGGAVDIDLQSKKVVVKQYESINVVTNNVTFSNPHDEGTIVMFRCQGDVTISATIDLDGLGAKGGIHGGTNNGGNKGDTPTTMLVRESGARGAGGGAALSSGADGGSKVLGSYTHTDEEAKNLDIAIACGAGGGGGGDDEASDSPNGGRGGGALLLTWFGELDFTGTISAAGEDGSPTGTGGGGGGGACGQVVMIGETITTNTGTISTPGGDGGSGGGGGDGGAGGGGGGSYSGAGGDGGAGVGGGGDGGAGGDGANGAGGGGGGGSESGAGGAGGSGGTSEGGIVTTFN